MDYTGFVFKQNGWFGQKLMISFKVATFGKFVIDWRYEEVGIRALCKLLKSVIYSNDKILVLLFQIKYDSKIT